MRGRRFIHCTASATIDNNNQTTEQEESFVEDRAGHVVMEEQRDQVVGQPFIDNVVQHRSFTQFSSPEMYMQTEEMFKSPVRLGSYAWTTAMLPLTTLWFVDLPQVLNSQPTFHKQLFQIYAFVKPAFEFTFQLNSTKFHQGQINAWYDPGKQYAPNDVIGSVPVWPVTPSGTIPGGYVFKRVSRASISQQSDCSIDAAYSNVAKLVVPFEHPMNCLTTNSVDPIDIMGRVRLSVFNQLQVKDGGTTAIYVQVWMRLVDLEVRYPMWPHDAIIPTFVAQMAGGKAPQQQKSSIGSDVSKAVNGIAGTAFNVETGNFAGLVKSVPEAVSGIAGVIGNFLDKPAEPKSTIENMIYPMSPLGHMKGIDRSVRLSAEPMGGYTDRERFSTSTGSELQLLNIAKTKSWAATGTWASSAPEGTTLYRIPVLPGFCDYSTAAGQVSINHTFLSYIASHFRYWRGGLSYRFDFKGTQIHSGRVSATFVPNIDSMAGTETYPQLTCCDTKQFDIHESREFTYDVGYFSSIDRKVWFDWALEPTSLLDDRFALGYVELRVATPLAVMEGVVDSIEFNIYVSAGDDFQFFWPCRSRNFRVYSSPVPDNVEFVAQMLPQRTENEGSDGPIAAGSGKVAPTSLSNEGISDVRDLGRRYCRLGEAKIGLITGVTLLSGSFRVNPALGCIDEGGALLSLTSDEYAARSQAMPFTISQLFAFYSGGARYKLMPREIQDSAGVSLPLDGVFQVVYVPEEDVGPEVEALGAPLFEYNSFPSVQTHLLQQRALEVEIPYTSAFNQLFQAARLTDAEITPADAPLGDVVIYYQPGPASKTANVLFIDVWWSFAEDTCFSFLCAPPPEYYNVLPSSTAKTIKQASIAARFLQAARRQVARLAW